MSVLLAIALLVTVYVGEPELDAVSTPDLVSQRHLAVVEDEVSAANVVTRFRAAGAAGELPAPSMAYQLQEYEDGWLDRFARLPHEIAVIDLMRDGVYFTAEEIARLKRTGKKVLGYFEIGSIEDFRPDFEEFRRADPDMLLNEVDGWAGEYFAKYWDERWLHQVVLPRVDRALDAGFDGVYLDTILAYEEIDLSLVPGRDREGLARDMVDLIVRISEYAKKRDRSFLIFPQNSPELRHFPGYTGAIDGIGMEELFFLDTDLPCRADFCSENLREARALRQAGKIVLAVDYATMPENIETACDRHAEEGFGGTVTAVELDRVPRPCR